MNKGFTLVETLVAISILIVAVTGAYSAAQTGLSAAAFSKNEVIASYLAQESIESIRNIRDENGLKGRDWLTGIALAQGDPCYPANGTQACKVDPIVPTITACPGGLGSCPLVKQDPTNGFYGYDSSWTDTTFGRDIILTTINDHEVSIMVNITWHKGTAQRSFRVRENILKWQ